MAGGAVIVREATDADLRPMLALCEKEWKHLGARHTINITRLRHLYHTMRIMVLYDGKDLVATLMGRSLETDRGPGYSIGVLVVDHDRTDRIALVDAVAMYGCNIAMSEGRRIVASQWKPPTFCLSNVRYGRDVLRFQINDEFDTIRQTGDAKAVIANILSRHPEWQLP